LITATIAPGRLLDVSNAADFVALTETNFEILTAEIFNLEGRARRRLQMHRGRHARDVEANASGGRNRGSVEAGRFRPAT
jgi:hypothetical protein